MAVEGWVGKEICTKGMVDGKKKGEGWGLGSEDLFTFPCPPPPLTPSPNLT